MKSGAMAAYAWPCFFMPDSICRMKSLAFPLALLIAFPVLAEDFFVATNGNDSWSGKLPAPNANATDGPFATVAQAQVAAHAAKTQSILVRGGTYYLQQPLSFTEKDSNLTIAAYQNEAPVFSGGRRITGWKLTDRGWWTVNLPEVKEGTWNFVQLFADGQ